MKKTWMVFFLKVGYWHRFEEKDVTYIYIYKKKKKKRRINNPLTRAVPPPPPSQHRRHQCGELCSCVSSFFHSFPPPLPPQFKVYGTENDVGTRQTPLPLPVKDIESYIKDALWRVDRLEIGNAVCIDWDRQGGGLSICRQDRVGLCRGHHGEVQTDPIGQEKRKKEKKIGRAHV